MGLTDDPADPRIVRGSHDTEPTPQHEVYLVLSDDEIAKGYVRPYRDTYLHVGPPAPQHELRDLTAEEVERYAGEGYVKFEDYPDDGESSAIGRYWTQDQLDAVAKGGCHTTTFMNARISETYARQPNFYGATYCVRCQKHLPVEEFVWIERSGEVGPRVGS